MNKKRRLDGYLSRKIQVIYPSALVYVDANGPVEVWTLEIKGEPFLDLGGSFGLARQAILAMLAAHKAEEAK